MVVLLAVALLMMVVTGMWFMNGIAPDATINIYE